MHGDVGEAPAPGQFAKFLGARIADLRKARRWSQGQLAEHIGLVLDRRVDPSQVSRIEGGLRDLSISETYAFATAFNLGLAEFVEGVANSAVRDILPALSQWQTARDRMDEIANELESTQQQINEAEDRLHDLIGYDEQRVEWAATFIVEDYMEGHRRWAKARRVWEARQRREASRAKR